RIDREFRRTRRSPHEVIPVGRSRWFGCAALDPCPGAIGDDLLTKQLCEGALVVLLRGARWIELQHLVSPVFELGADALGVRREVCPPFYKPRSKQRPLVGIPAGQQGNLMLFTLSISLYGVLRHDGMACEGPTSGDRGACKAAASATLTPSTNEWTRTASISM